MEEAASQKLELVVVGFLKIGTCGGNGFLKIGIIGWRGFLKMGMSGFLKIGMNGGKGLKNFPSS